MSALTDAIDALVTANRILAHEEVCDAYGHVSLRHPDKPDRFLLSRSRSPELVEPEDILEFTLDGEPVDAKGMPIYIERPIHARIFAARPDVLSVVHNHSYAVVPFTISSVPLRPVAHICARIGADIPKWDIHDRFGDTDLLVTTNEQGDDLAGCLGRHRCVLMRGHGATVIGTSLEDAVTNAIYLQVNARLQMDAIRLGGDVQYIRPGEIEIRVSRNESFSGFSRAWEYFSRRAGR